MNVRPNQVQDPATVLDWLRAQVSVGAHLQMDSRAIRHGDVFIACVGLRSDGRHYIAQALAHGAGAVLYEAADTQTGDMPGPALAVLGLRAMLGELADQWYGQPSATMSVVAITGTNGKTSCVQWIAGALTRLGRPCGTLGTLGAVLPDGQSLGGTLTTPDVVSVHRTLAAMRDAGAAAVALEASSIGLDQGRLDGVRIKVAGFTNLTRDHLDYHGTMERYEAAKALLFRSAGLSAAVVNADDPAGRRIGADLPAGRVRTYALDDGQADIRAKDLQAVTQGQVFALAMPDGEAQIITRLLGRHNVYNLLLVAGVLSALGFPLTQISRQLAEAAPVDGRMQVVEPPSAIGSVAGPMVVVDYSHTPDSLERALDALRPVVRARGGKLVCVFGCGGERDAGKRPQMGRIAAIGADRIVVTSDNPRGEVPEAIIEEIMLGVPVGAAVQARVDRSQAILHAIWSSAAQDVVLLAGKGHETYQEIAGRKLPLDDREWARLALLLPHVPAVSTDTRSIGKDELFLALSGENFDGHNYLAQAQSAGACAAVVAHRVADCVLPQLVLGDTRLALGRIGAAWRARFALPVIAVAGSNGKTTTKEMVSAVLAAWQGEENRLATAGNFNNDIGVPLTLLRLRLRHRAAVFELGMNHPGEIAYLAEMAAADVALVNNAQREHQEFMHSVQAVARENGAAIAALPPGGVAVYPGDDAYTWVWDELAGARRKLRFGLAPGVEIYAQNIHSDASGSRCEVVTPLGRIELALSVPGLHNLRNALAALACGLAAGASLDVAARALASFSAVKGRMQRKVMDDGSVLIDDTYNANADSVRAAIDVLAALAGPRALVLGDMGEVGDNGPAMHREVGEYARSRGIEALFTLGEATRLSAESFGQGAHACGTVDEILAGLRKQTYVSILVKGSRFMRMERVVQGLAARGQGTGGAYAA
ncbi:bifunctional UDP-N-acetylmuramoyl-L-alanyl-D-glutamate--2,6-diaminopimelate ligase MurE/UDP-N-acetylmuramoyl-tripeptide--D-alanyl-D-alanine ligase MurF [Bordetella sp. FB-8]|uniref:bifunctional UDP-N-acetylmuramoyl-L-alanyl-D-glutamate--2, 6-diaminopimelate ligase MurE/UDP-N-acetylmuramoyl-tripeptide--D-alanyl-D-alanine ligase MurF n=1 Tax=Bordetella sp. FB-8 TaxID=1159870 RepID=UPI00036B2706|nr:bifunctional UDP-N-acetylmuramoyl-L-alanyl-D-glutamate--2,6-diaminopimelate ligase MurE/UDP-N-acetylmuramoyl-tripeptide--D-alanyl-D-alanine ligase MurF [Bordetella sp. FB-8]